MMMTNAKTWAGKRHVHHISYTEHVIFCLYGHLIKYQFITFRNKVLIAYFVEALTSESRLFDRDLITSSQKKRGASDSVR